MRDQQTIEKLNYFFRGNQDATEFALMLIHVCDVWDDLTDKDEPVTQEAINKAFWFCLSGIPRNGFYRRFTDELTPLIETGIFNWIAADVLMARGGQKEMEIANIVRHDIGDVFVHMARLIGGFDWAASVTAEIKLLIQNDTLEEFLKE